ncbi:alpha/beta fold hydrolase [Gordonia sp. HNM0687]|uniref:Alpha/beta fold hydrolase n=1 Tax=Gordonia mangrovi TaxID=2665643 RepID=A0A6L7GLD1_9ACTN|nr:alpha/beta fold hydrolase [Gordonia mangrovi]MXP20700.1 alpha/beta fold hydrolase [Gordonia mangrovi]UVF78728.1 alpha/beta fold hydrolase [Gordonia mangrovi]
MSLTTHVFGPDADDTAHILALHGLTGHGRRWAALAREHLADLRIVAPDLLGHGRSPWTPPWSFDDHLDALAAVVDMYIPPTRRPFVIVGHSFGGALAVRLAHRLGDAVGGLVLLDPAQGLDPPWALEVATDSLANWDYADADHARSTKRDEGWADIPEALLDKEIDEHLIPLANGRMGWRVSAPAAATAWSEMARDAVLPPAGLPTAVVVADRVRPPFVGADFLASCVGVESTRVVHADCGHMVPYLAPELTAALIREMVGGG